MKYKWIGKCSHFYLCRGERSGKSRLTEVSIDGESDWKGGMFRFTTQRGRHDCGISEGSPRIEIGLTSSIIIHGLKVPGTRGILTAALPNDE